MKKETCFKALYTLLYTKRGKTCLKNLTKGSKNAILASTIFHLMTTSPQKNDPKELIRVSVSEAARLFGVNSQTIRRAIASQEVTYVVVAGRYKLNFESLVKWSQRHTTVKNKLAKKGIGQFVDRWKIKNPLYSPNPKSVTPKQPVPDVTSAIDDTPPLLDQNDTTDSTTQPTA